jgi:hypothetical protein
MMADGRFPEESKEAVDRLKKARTTHHAPDTRYQIQIPACVRCFSKFEVGAEV